MQKARLAAAEQQDVWPAVYDAVGAVGENGIVVENNKSATIYLYVCFSDSIPRQCAVLCCVVEMNTRTMSTLPVESAFWVDRDWLLMLFAWIILPYICTYSIERGTSGYNCYMHVFHTHAFNNVICRVYYSLKSVWTKLLNNIYLVCCTDIWSELA